MNTEQPGFAATCQRCGQPVSAPPFVRVGEAYCCEACYLRPHTLAPAKAIRVEAALAQALAAVLDLREHETGPHSQRVACHTPGWLALGLFNVTLAALVIGVPFAWCYNLAGKCSCCR